MKTTLPEPEIVTRKGEEVFVSIPPLPPNSVAEFMASQFEIHRSEMRMLDAGRGQFPPEFIRQGPECFAES